MYYDQSYIQKYLKIYLKMLNVVKMEIFDYDYWIFLMLSSDQSSVAQSIVSSELYSILKNLKIYLRMLSLVQLEILNYIS